MAIFNSKIFDVQFYSPVDLLPTMKDWLGGAQKVSMVF